MVVFVPMDTTGQPVATTKVVEVADPSWPAPAHRIRGVGYTQTTHEQGIKALILWATLHNPKKHHAGLTVLPVASEATENGYISDINLVQGV